MLTDKQLKIKYRKEFETNPKTYYPTQAIESFGMHRNRCATCNKFFWNVDSKRTVCGDATCTGGFTFIGNTPAKHKLDYIDVWKTFAKIMKGFGYTEIKRYPVVARWRNDIHFVEASIDDFMPYVINGEVEPPANPVIVPQFCLRFNDVDNVGITGHNTGFVMMGQLHFRAPQEYRPNEYLHELMVWFTKGMGIPVEEITLHEDVWSGAGNFGPCIEFFSRGLELANQVYMQYRQTKTGYHDLQLKVLDMGEGQERAAWFSQGKESSYETTFPTVIKKMRELTGYKADPEFMKAFLPYSSYLNIDEVDDINKTWNTVAQKLGIDVEELKNKVLPNAALYAIAEHTRSFLFSVTDGGLPSNVGGGYNIRVILRRALGFIDQYEWDIDLATLCELHAQYLKPLFPEVSRSLDVLSDMIQIEQERFNTLKTKHEKIIQNIIGKTTITKKEIINLYESHGISPEVLAKEAKNHHKEIKIPEDFYGKLSEKHRKKDEEKETPEFNNVPETEMLFYDITKKEFDATVVHIYDGNKIILDKTCFYGKSGGQDTDTGTLNGVKVTQVEKIGNILVHHVEKNAFKKGDTVRGIVDWDRRQQLMKHHTAVHIVNGAARAVLGNHIWQAGANKTMKKATLDITHYKTITNHEREQIEKQANDIVTQAIAIKKQTFSRTEAEKKYGMHIYQGGAIPQKNLRIVAIGSFDVEACGGTHLDNTKDAEKIIITNTERIQDGIIRLTLLAGAAAHAFEKTQEKILKEIEEILGVKGEKTIHEAEKLFTAWKKEKKKKKNITSIVHELQKKVDDNILIAMVEERTVKELQAIAKQVSDPYRLVILFTGTNPAHFIVTAGKHTKYDAQKITKSVAKIMNGKGGGSAHLGQGVGSVKTSSKQILRELRDAL